MCGQNCSFQWCLWSPTQRHLLACPLPQIRRIRNADAVTPICKSMFADLCDTTWRSVLKCFPRKDDGDPWSLLMLDQSPYWMFSRNIKMMAVSNSLVLVFYSFYFPPIHPSHTFSVTAHSNKSKTVKQTNETFPHHHSLSLLKKLPWKGKEENSYNLLPWESSLRAQAL